MIGSKARLPRWLAVLQASLLLAFARPPAPVLAQRADRALSTNVNGWYGYAGSHAIAKAYSVLLDAEVRRWRVAAAPQQVLLRGAVVRSLGAAATAGAGYGFFWNSPYGDFSDAFASPEHRIFEQLGLAHDIGTVAVAHRLRLEHRGTGQQADHDRDGDARVTTWTFANRGRYQALGTIPLRGSAPDPGALSAELGDEVFVNLGPTARQTTLDQNRVSLGFSVRWSRTTTVYAGYMHQLIVQHAARALEANHTLRLALHSDASFSGR